MFSFLRFIFSLEFLLKIRVWWSLSYTIFHLEGKSQWYVYFFHRIQIPLQMSFRYINFGHTVYILSGTQLKSIKLNQQFDHFFIIVDFSRKLYTKQLLWNKKFKSLQLKQNLFFTMAKLLWFCKFRNPIRNLL